MNKFLIVAILAFGATQTRGDDSCYATQSWGGGECYTSAEMGSGWGSFFAVGDPCFKYGGGHYCFISKTGSIGSCECSNDACGCDKKPVDHCTNEGVNTSPNCATTQEKWCESKYNYNGYENTKCLYCGVDLNNCNNKVCTNGITTDDDKNAIVNAHNKFRRMVALGEVQSGDPGPQPSAANMMELEWDDELASWAQLWVEQCIDGHDKDRNIGVVTNYDIKNYVGQNRYDGWSSEYSSYRNYTAFVEAWFNEVKDWPASAVSSYYVTSGPETGHYTQVIWAKTTKVGCGFTAWDEGSAGGATPYRQAFICNYWIGGNLLGSPVYIEGSPASQCPSGTSANNGLCSSSSYDYYD